MKDFDIFSMAFNDYYTKQKDRSLAEIQELFKDFYIKIKDLNCNDFRLYYYKARYLNGENQLYEAKDNVDCAVTLIGKINQYGLIENSSVLFVPDGRGNYYPCYYQEHINKTISDVFYCAGEIYAKMDAMEESARYYRIGQYYHTFFKSEFENANNVIVFSFRNYNEYSLSDLINNTITVCPSSKMNDPFDSIINLWGDTDNLEKICTDKKHIMPMCSAFNLYRIRSFCLGNRNTPIKKVLMWSHYAGEHTGFCIKYKLSNHFIKQKENGNYEHMYLKKIEYTNEKISIATTSINTDVAFATKSKEWRYENEVRLIVYNPNKTEQFYGIELDDESEIEAIFFGYRCSEVAINTIKNIFINKNTKVPKFYKMILDENNVYNLKYEVVK